MENNTRFTEHDEWIRFVRDPAPYRSEGPRRIVAGGKKGCVLKYQLAPLDQGYELEYSIEFPGYAGCSVPWTLFASRQEAVAHLVSACSAYCRRELDSEMSTCPRRTKAAAAAMLQILEPHSLFGFQEPEPAPKADWYDAMLKDQLCSMTMEQNWALLDVVRGHDYSPISASGSFFDIPVPTQ